MPGEPAIRVGRVTRVLNEFVAPARRGPAITLQVEAHHVHGEPIPATEAFNASFEPFSVGQSFGPAWDTTWFRLRGTVPEDWRGKEVMVGFAIGNAGNTGFGAESLLYRAGRPVQGLSPNHREFQAFSSAAGGERVEYLVEVGANPPSPFGANPWPMLLAEPHGEPLFTLQRADLHVRDPSFEEFWHDFRTALEVVLELPDGDPRRSRLLGALDRACNLLELPTIGDSWRRAHPLIRQALLRPGAPGRHRVSAVGHAHIDTAWLWPLRETVRKCARTYATVLALMERFPEYRFAAPAAQHLVWMRDHYPDLWERMKERIAEGRLEPTGSMWVEADCNVPSGESLVRQIVLGKRFYREELGIDTVDVWLPDVFGYSAALPQIMRRAGIRYFLTQKLSWNQYNVLPHHSFYWEGIDGSRVFTHFPPADTYGGRMSVQELRFGESNFLDHDRSGRQLYPFGWGDGGGGPTETMLESARRFADIDGLPFVAMEGPRRFFEQAEAEMVDPPVWVGELYLEYHRGTYTTQAKTKWGNRRAELALRDVELWSTAHEGAEGYPGRELEEWWRTLLVHQFHDIIPGSGIHWVYQDTERDHRRILSEARATTRRALERSSARVDASGCSMPVVVWNSLSHPRQELVQVGVEPGTATAVDDRGLAVPLQPLGPTEALLLADVPACGYRRYDLTERPVPAWSSPLTAAVDRLENEFLVASFDERGLLVSLFDKEAAREVLPPGRPANLFRLHPDYPNFYDAWDVDPFYREQGEDLVALDSLEVIEAGPMRAALKMVRSFGKSSLTQEVRLVASTRQLEFFTIVEWAETNRLLKVGFPLAVRSPRATYEIQYGHLERPTHANTSWDAARFEVCAHRWADVSEPGYGVALLNDCKYGYDVHGDVMSLSLLRSPTWPDPVADRGQHHFTYRVFPHQGDLREAGVIDAGYDLNVGLEVCTVAAGEGSAPSSASLFSLDAPHVVLEVVKRADEEPRAVVVRLYEAWGKRGPATLQTPWELAGAWRSDLLEHEEAPLEVEGRAVRFDLSPFEILTIKLRPSVDVGDGP